jgi:hypothetical protein
MNDLTRDILTQIQSGKSVFKPTDESHNSLMEFQPTAKRIEWGKKREYIKDARFLRTSVGNSFGLVVAAIVISGGLDLPGVCRTS